MKLGKLMRRKGEGKGEDILSLPRQNYCLDCKRTFELLSCALQLLERVRGAEPTANEIRAYLNEKKD